MKTRTFIAVSALFLLASLFLVSPHLEGQTFKVDDPLWIDPDQLDMPAPREVSLSDYYDFLENTFSSPGGEKGVRAFNTNTLDEVPDSSWYENRHYLHPLSREELTNGPGQGLGPSMAAPWRIVSGKSQGITPGFTIVDGRGDRYLVKFDPRSNPEMATGAEIISTKFFHALGYHTPENHLVYFTTDQLSIDPQATMKNNVGKKIPLTEKRVSAMLSLVPRDGRGYYRAVASKFIKGAPLGPFRYYGTRPDDGNDIFPHQHRRELRGLRIFSAWLNHDDSRSINTLDVLVEEEGRQYVRHYLIDFGSTLGSGSVFAQKRRPGNEYKFEIKPTLASMATLGIWQRPWVTVAYPEDPAVGRFEGDFFDPHKWKPEYPNPAFLRCDAADAFWAAKQVMNFADAEIRAVVSTAGFSNPESERCLVETLVKRRDKIGGAYLYYGGGLDKFEVQKDRLVFMDLLSKFGLQGAGRQRRITWHAFDNAGGRPTERLDGGALNATSSPVPDASSRYLVATIETQGLGATRVFLRRTGTGLEVVGVSRE